MDAGTHLLSGTELNIRSGRIAVEFLLSSPNSQVANVTGIAMALQKGRAAYIPIGHDDTQDFQDAFQCLELEGNSCLTSELL